jgi:peptidoglycan DL-endopeptidase CwlO
VAIRRSVRAPLLFVLTAAVLMGPAVLARPLIAGASPEPSVVEVQHQLDDMARRDARLVEQYDQAQLVAQKQDRAAAAASRAQAQADAAYNRLHGEFLQILQAQYEGDSLGAAGALLDSTSNNNYLERLQMLSMMSDHTADVIDQDTVARKAAEAAAAHAEQVAAQAKAQRDELGQRRAAVGAEIHKFQDLLTSLNTAQQDAYFEGANPAVKPSQVASLHLPKAPTRRAQRAVDFALSQLGKPYVFGAAGPTTYDCSGLTMRSWQAGGISLPHSAADQSGMGQRVSKADLQPGDLIFFYHPVDHVTIYVGNGYMVSAPTEGEDVSLVPVGAFNKDYAWSVRLR